MMKTDVYLLRTSAAESEEQLSQRLGRILEAGDCFAFIEPNDLVAIKTHFGEDGTEGYVRPVYLRRVGELVKKKQGLPFLTETSTLYSGRRSNAVEHLGLAYAHGFDFAGTGMPIIMADGLWGDGETEVAIAGKIYSRVKLAEGIVKAQSLIAVSHFTGHVATGFGGALKNLGMGCASRRGKLNQHSTAKPSIRRKKCTGCGTCLPWCPRQAIVLVDRVARIDSQLCIGCGECLTVCRVNAIGFNWVVSYEQLQKKIVEHAWGVAESKKGKAFYLTFLTRVSRDCDCMGPYRQIVPDIGILLAADPVAIDAAALDLVERQLGRPLSQVAYDIPCRVQIEYAREIGFGNSEYSLCEVD